MFDFIAKRQVDMTGVTVVYRADNGTTRYVLEEGQHRREFTIEHCFAGTKRLVGCSEISRFVTPFEAFRSRFKTAGKMDWICITREDGWITRSHQRTLRKVLKSARADIAKSRAKEELDAAGQDARLHALATGD